MLCGQLLLVSGEVWALACRGQSDFTWLHWPREGGAITEAAASTSPSGQPGTGIGDSWVTVGEQDVTVLEVGTTQMRGHFPLVLPAKVKLPVAPYRPGEPLAFHVQLARSAAWAGGNVLALWTGPGEPGGLPRFLAAFSPTGELRWHRALHDFDAIGAGPP
jgi:hypothetical protein